MRLASFILLFFNVLCLQGQEDTTKQKFSDIFELSGYIKNLQILSFGNHLEDIVNDNLIHNRLNFKLYPSNKWTAALEIRNRIFTGESQESIPKYADLIGQDDGIVNLSVTLINERSLIMISKIDRAWVEWASNNWEVRIGRQRINWGINLFWNSNDLFNAYSLVDFDYEERAGSDALRVQRHFKNLSTLEVAVKPASGSEEWTGAMRYGFNKWQYDFQFIIGKFDNNFALGGGWAGNLGQAGLKGEITYFHPTEKMAHNIKSLSASMSMDYLFSNQLFLTAGYLFVSQGLNTPSQLSQNLFLQPVSAKNLMPSKHNTIVAVSFPLSPLASVSFNTVYSPGVQSLLLMPSVSWSISNNWELSLLAQNFNLKVEDFDNIGNGFFFRVKGSF